MIIETNITTGVSTTREYTAKELADIEASKPTPAEIAATAVTQAKATLSAIHLSSIGAILTWIARQPDAGVFLKQQEALAAAERLKL